ncbi:nitroreductase family protein [Chloroflexota bacterium]
MLTVLEAIQKRRSIRKYLPEDVPQEMIDQMIETARLAPSGSNRQPWRFLVIREQETKKELRRICLDQKFIEEAPVVIVCFGDLERYSLEARNQRSQEFTNSGVLETLSGRFADPKFRESMNSLPTPSREELITPLVSNTYIAIEHMVLMATALGIGTCWVGAFNAKELNDLFGLTDNLIPVAVIPVGYPAGDIPPQRPRLKLEEIILKPNILVSSNS